MLVTLMINTSTSLLYCNGCNKFLVDVERFVFLLWFAHCVNFAWTCLLSYLTRSHGMYSDCLFIIHIHIYLYHSRLWDQQYFISTWHLSSWNVWTSRTFWNYSLHDNQWSIKILSKVCFGSSPRLVLCMLAFMESSHIRPVVKAQMSFYFRLDLWNEVVQDITYNNKYIYKGGAGTMGFQHWLWIWWKWMCCRKWKNCWKEGFETYPERNTWCFTTNICKYKLSTFTGLLV
jgi:hypothetical protein